MREHICTSCVGERAILSRQVLYQLKEDGALPPCTPMEIELMTMRVIRNFWNKSSDNTMSWKCHI